MNKIHNYPKVWNLGHKAVKDIFKDPVYVQEKVDGSQFSFALVDGSLVCKSKNATRSLSSPDKLFAPAVETAKKLADFDLLDEGKVYRAEAMYAPCHNTLEYNRRPKGGMVLFDVEIGREDRLPPEKVISEAQRLGIDAAPFLYHGEIDELDDLKSFLEEESFLGGARMEGIVVKNPERFNPKTSKQLMAKLVREDFREKNSQNHNTKGIKRKIIDKYRNVNRWKKAVQHMRDAGDLQHAPQDIGPLIKEVQQDIKEEEEEEIKEMLFDYYWPKVRNAFTGGLPEWYKDRLAERQFDE